jgi:hypothetical protein
MMPYPLRCIATSAEWHPSECRHGVAGPLVSVSLRHEYGRGLTRGVCRFLGVVCEGPVGGLRLLPPQDRIQQGVQPREGLRVRFLEAVWAFLRDESHDDHGAIEV